MSPRQKLYTLLSHWHPKTLLENVGKPTPRKMPGNTDICWVALRVQSFHLAMGWVGLSWVRVVHGSILCDPIQPNPTHYK